MPGEPDRQPSIRTFLRRVDAEVVRLGTRDHVAIERLLRRSASSWTDQALRAALASLLAGDETQWRQIATVFDSVFEVLPSTGVGLPGTKADDDEPGAIEPSAAPAMAGAHARRLRLDRPAGQSWVQRQRLRWAHLARTARNAPRGWWLAAVVVILMTIVGFAFDRFSRVPTPVEPTTVSADVTEIPPPSGPRYALAPVTNPPPDDPTSITTPVSRPTPAAGLLVTLVVVASALIVVGWTWWTLPATVGRQRAQARSARTARANAARAALADESAAAGRPAELRYHVAPHWGDLRRQTVADTAEVLGGGGARRPGRDLDPDATVARTVARAGRFTQVLASRRTRAEVVVLIDIESGCPPYWSVFERVLDAWAAQGVGLRRYTFHGSPDSVTDASTHRPMAITRLARRAEGAPLILYGRRLDPFGFRGTARWPEALAAWSRRAWLDPVARPADERSRGMRHVIFALERLGLPRFTLTNEGLLAMARWLAGQPQAGATEPTPLPTLPALAAAGEGSALAEGLRQWALVGALVPDPTWDQLEAIRRHFPELARALPEARYLQLLIEWVERDTGTTAERDGTRGGLRIPAARQQAWKADQLRLDGHRPRHTWLEIRARALLIQQLGPNPPSDPLEAYWWRLKRALHQAVLTPDETSELLALIDSPIGHDAAIQIRDELERQDTVGVRLFGRANEDALRAGIGGATGVPLPALLVGGVPGWRGWVRPIGSLAVAMALTVIGAWPWNNSAWLARPQARATERVPVWRLVENDATLPEMVRIPGGAFQMGSNDGDADEQPVRTVTIAPFEIARTEVTVAQYRRCFDDNGACRRPDNGRDCNWGVDGRDDHPVNCVSWDDAQTYAQWLGARLPSEAEWEYAARGGGLDREFPWGHEPADCQRAVIDDGVSGNGCGTESTATVCSKPAGHSVHGLCDMAGNVWEWVADDWHSSYAQAPGSGEAWVDTPRSEDRVFRGGSWRFGPRFARVAFRSRAGPSSRLGDLGFRVARSLPSSL